LTAWRKVFYIDQHRPAPKWRNWQTRQVQDLVSVKDVEVRVLSSALAKTPEITGVFAFDEGHAHHSAAAGAHHSS
jgi:hypothetical protein